MSNYLESFLQLLNGKNIHTIVWTADINYWIDGQVFTGKADSDWRNEEGYLKFCNDLHIIPYYWYGKFWLGEPEYDNTVQVIIKEKGYNTNCIWKTRYCQKYYEKMK